MIIIIEFFFVTGISLMVSSLNVLFRDLQHLISILLMVWFFVTPVIYPISMVPEKFQFYMFLNPMTVFVTLYRNIFYYVKYPQGFYIPPLEILLACLGITFLFFILGYFIFKKVESRFAEEV